MRVVPDTPSQLLKCQILFSPKLVHHIFFLIEKTGVVGVGCMHSKTKKILRVPLGIGIDNVQIPCDARGAHLAPDK